MDLLISNATILTMDEAMHIHFGAHLGITGSKITYIGKDAPKEAPEKIIAGTGMVIFLILLFVPDILVKADEADRKAEEKKKTAEEKEHVDV